MSSFIILPLTLPHTYCGPSRQLGCLGEQEVLLVPAVEKAEREALVKTDTVDHALEETSVD